MQGSATRPTPTNMRVPHSTFFWLGGDFDFHFSNPTVWSKTDHDIAHRKIPTQAKPAWTGHPPDARLGHPPFTVQQNVSEIGPFIGVQDQFANNAPQQLQTDDIGWVGGPLPATYFNVQQVTYTITSPTSAFSPYNLTTVINQTVVISGGQVTAGFPTVIQKHQRPYRIRKVPTWVR